MDKFKEIQNRLNAFTLQEPSEGPNKMKMKQLQVMISRLSSSLEEDDITREYKLNEMLEKVRKLESLIKEIDQESTIKQSTLESSINRLEKTFLKKLEKLSKQKKEADKEFQSQLNNYLIELSGFKTKMTNSCLGSIALIKQKEIEIEELHKSHQENTQVTKEILRKIYQQYAGQLEELKRLVDEEERQRVKEDDILMERLEKVYEKLSKELKEIKKERENSEGEMILLLEKVVERVRYEVVKM